MRQKAYGDYRPPAPREITRSDVAAGDIAAKLIENGVMVAPGLQTNAFTLAEHQGQERTKPPLTREEAVAVGHRSVEIDRWFGLAPGIAVNETGKPAGQ